MVILGVLLVFMVWGRVFGVVLRLCVLVVCVGLVGCRLSDPGSVDELRLLEVSQGAGDRGQGAGDGDSVTGPLEARQALLAREVLADFPLESVLYVDVSGDRGQVTGDRRQEAGVRGQETERLQGYLNQAFAGFQGMAEGKEGSGSGSGSGSGFSSSSVLSPVSSEVSSHLDQAWGQAAGLLPDGMAGDLPYQDQRFVSAFYGAMQGLAGQKVGQAKGAVQQAVLRNTGLSEDTGSGGVDPEMFAHLSEEGKLALTQAMVNAALDAGSEEVSSFMAQLETSFSASQEGDPTYSLLGVVPVWESSDLAHTTFVQGTILSEDQRTTMNLGGAYRYLSADHQHLYGVNAFYDQEFRYDHRRMSFGADYQNSLLGLQANRYVALSDWRSGSKTGFEERALSGYDAQISGKLPWVAGLEAFYKRLIWQRKTDKDIQGEQVGLEYTPVPAITLRAGHEKDDERGSGFMAGVQLNTTLGGQEGVDPLAWTESEDFLDVAQNRYQKVRRENSIRTEAREKTNASAPQSMRTQQVSSVVGSPTFGPMGMSPAGVLSVGTQIPNDSDVLSEVGEGLTVTFSDGGVMMVGSDVRVRIQDTRVTYLAGTGSLQYVSGTGTPHILSVPGGEVQLLGTDISVVPQSALASSVMVYDGRIVATARDGSNALVPSETEAGNSGDVVLLSTLSATTGEASKLSPTDPIITQHQGHVFEDRTRDPQQMEVITQNPKAVPFVTQMPVYTGTSVPAVGQSFEMTVTFSKPVVVTGLPSLRLVLTASPSGETRYATYVGGSGTNTLTFRWDPVDVGGITGFEVTQIDQSSGSITSADGSERAESFVPSTTFAMPSYSIAVSPSVIDYTNQNSVVLNVANYGSGNMAVVSLNGNALPAVSAAASLPLDVTGLPDGPITIEYYEIAGTQTLLSVSAAATKDISDTIPPTVTMDAITSPSANTTQTLTGTVSDNLGTPSVVVGLSPRGITQGATVTGTAPNYTWTATVSGLSDDTYTVTARATDGMGNITDTAPQTLSINTAAPSATLSTIAGSAYTGTQILTNDATPTLAGTATGGGSASVSQVEISLDGGSTWSPATATANWSYTPSANLADTIYNVQVRVTNSVGTQSVTPFDSAMRVDATAPSITDVTSPADATYGSGQNLDFVATMSEATTVDITSGTPRIPLTIGSTTQYATYLSGSGTTSLTFRYITQSGDNDTDGIAVTSPVQLNGGTLRDSAGNDATLTFTPPTTTGVLVDTTAPTITGIALDSPNSCGSDGICVTGDTLRYIVTFSEPVTLTGAGTLTLPLTLTSGVASAVYTNSAPTTTSTVTVSRTILAGDTHTTGNITLATPLTLATTTITDTAGNPATLTHSSTSLGGILINNAPLPVNTVAPTVSGVGYNGQTMTCNAGTWTGSPTGYAYKWYSSAAEISGQTASTYTVTATTEGTPLTCAVAATNAAGTSAYTNASNTIHNWVPTQTDMQSTGLLLHATNGVQTAASKVTRWDSQFNGWSFQQGSDTIRPVLSTWSSSEPALLNSGLGSQSTRLTGTTLFTPFENATAFTVLVTFKSTGTGWIFEKGSSTSTPSERVGLVVISDSLFIVVNDSAVTTTVNNSTNYIASITYNGGAVTMRLNGQQVQTGTLANQTGGNGTNRLVIGPGVDPHVMPGLVRDIVILPYSANTQTVEKWEGYLHWRAGATSTTLSNTLHPFYSRPPMISD
jgi:hypothetical protein